MKNITLSAEDRLIESARQRALVEQTTLNELFRGWLTQYVQPDSRVRKYDAVMEEVRGKLRVGRKLSRDEMNER